jgi:hypothetical protein
LGSLGSVGSAERIVVIVMPSTIAIIGPIDRSRIKNLHPANRMLLV